MSSASSSAIGQRPPGTKGAALVVREELHGIEARGSPGTRPRRRSAASRSGADDARQPPLDAGGRVHVLDEDLPVPSKKPDRSCWSSGAAFHMERSMSPAKPRSCSRTHFPVVGADLRPARDQSRSYGPKPAGAGRSDFAVNEPVRGLDVRRPGATSPALFASFTGAKPMPIEVLREALAAERPVPDRHLGEDLQVARHAVAAPGAIADDVELLVDRAELDPHRRGRPGTRFAVPQRPCTSSSARCFGMRSSITASLPSSDAAEGAGSTSGRRRRSGPRSQSTRSLRTK